jgi:hypothetical protein
MALVVEIPATSARALVMVTAAVSTISVALPKITAALGANLNLGTARLQALRMQTTLLRYSPRPQPDTLPQELQKSLTLYLHERIR